MKTKIISMLLAILMCLLLCIPAAATEINSECKYDSGYAIVIIPSGNGEQITLAVRDCANGDVEFVLREDNEVVSRVYLNRCESTIRSENYTQPSGPETTVKIVPRRTQVNTQSLRKVVEAQSGVIGGITYRYYTQGYPFTNRVTFTLTTTAYPNSRYNLNGRYQTIAEFAAFAASILSLSGIIASELVVTICSILGLTISGAAAIVIPDYYVRATEYENTWNTMCGSTSGVLRGSKFIFTHERTNETQTAYEDTYWSWSSYNSHNGTFAEAIRQNTPVYWGSDGVYEVVSWG